MVNFNDKDNKHTRLYLFSVVLYDIAISSEVRFQKPKSKDLGLL